jgi:inner membrane protein
MPSIFSHALIPLAAGGALGRGRIAPQLAMAGALLAVVPDFDVIGFRFGIGYASEWGHRGFTHSLAFAALLAGMVALFWMPARSIGAMLFLFACIASHPLLDMLTDGGQGVALLWPFDKARLFSPWQPIRVAPIGLRFFTARGVETIWSELATIWLPSLAIAGIAMTLRRTRSARA